MKKPSRLRIAQAARREITKLQAQRERVYAKALKDLNILDTSCAFDYFFNTPNEGYSKWEEDYLK